MKPRILVTAMLAVLGASCSTFDKQQMALRIEPVQSIRHGVTSAQSYYQLGRYYHGQNRLDQAENAYLKAIAIDDRSIDAFNALGSLYAQRGETERAAKMFERLTALAADTAYLHNNLGYVYFLAGRLDEAYESVRKALVLDGTLERAWENLKKIASQEGDTKLQEVASLRKVDALPLAMGLNANPGTPDAESKPVATALALDSTFTSTTRPSSTPRLEDMRIADAANVVVTSNTLEKPAVTIVEDLPEREVLSGMTRKPVQNSDGEFVVVSARQKLVSNGRPIEISPPLVTALNVVADKPASVASGPKVIADKPAPVAKVRLEVSNGNGIPHAANNFSSRLRKHNIPVMKITNHASFLMKQTVVEYQPEFEQAARLLMDRANLNARLVAAIRTRDGVDIRIVLGKDASNFDNLRVIAKKQKTNFS